ncbi:MAG: GNAT family N-acetyltransferase [Anaerolineales bacterium]|jgi:ribosomal-protein-alanine N-acetyltransferase|nr:GNAT family N-acetyltransferase [Anaerolineales bacterium]WKZ41828.1 MAG: GNAT family N-acetyltransferase [Anaerolineales bacterium]
MDIVKASILDLNSLRILERESFAQDAWPLFDLIAVLTFPDVIRLKAMEGKKMVGFVAGDPRPRDGWGWIATIAVDPRFQRRGIGRALLEQCERQLGVPRARLTVRASNSGAISMYEQAGYLPIDVWKAYYNDGEDALVMEKDL